MEIRINEASALAQPVCVNFDFLKKNLCLREKSPARLSPGPAAGI